MSDVIATGKEKIKEYLSTVMHALFDECDYYHPDISDIPFLNFFSNKLKLTVCSESCRMPKRGHRKRGNLLLLKFNIVQRRECQRIVW